MKLTYIEIKKIVNSIVTRVISEMNGRYNNIPEFLEKYRCADEREFIHMMLCQYSNSANIDLSIRELINNLEEESYQMNFDLDFTRSQLKKEEAYTKFLHNEMKTMTNLIKVLNEKVSYVERYYDDVQLVLRYHNISFEETIKSIKPNATPPKKPGLKL